MNRSSEILLAAVMASSGWFSGCAGSATVPPPASIPSVQPQPSVPNVTRYVPPPPVVNAPPKAESNPWKPKVALREWKYIVIHHTATENGSVESIHEAHLKNKDSKGNPWLGIGYHFVIGNGHGMGDGEIEPTFRWKQQMHGAHAGAGNKDHNDHGIGVCLVGNFENHPPTEAQRRSIKRLVAILKRDYNISSGQIIGHKDIRSTECPGKMFPMAEVAVAGDEFSPSPSRLSDAHNPDDLAVLPGSSRQ